MPTLKAELDTGKDERLLETELTNGEDESLLDDGESRLLLGFVDKMPLLSP